MFKTQSCIYNISILKKKPYDHKQLMQKKHLKKININYDKNSEQTRTTRELRQLDKRCLQKTYN